MTGYDRNGRRDAQDGQEHAFMRHLLNGQGAEGKPFKTRLEHAGKKREQTAAQQRRRKDRP